MTKIKRILCALGLLLATQAGLAQQPPPAARSPLDPAALTESQITGMQVPTALYKLAGYYKQTSDFERLTWTLQRLTELLPNAGDLKLTLATAYAVQGNKEKTYGLLMAMRNQGYGYDLSANPNFAKVADGKAWAFMVDGLKTNLEPFGKGAPAFSLPNGDHLFESLAFDPKRQQFLVGSVRDGSVSLVDKNGRLTDFVSADAQNGMWAVYALAIDAGNDALYVASTSSVYFKRFSSDDAGKAGIFRFRLSTGKFVDKFVFAADTQQHTLSSIAVGTNGQVFAADGLRNIIYRLDGGALKPLVENPRLTSIRGLALSGDGSKLYFADYTMGVFGVDLTAGKGFDIAADPAHVALGGVDGLYWYDNNLVVIQNGMSPHRVMRLTLGADGRSIERITPLDVGRPEFTLPTSGAIDGDGLYFIANSQKNEYDSHGSPKDPARLEAVRVFRSNLRYAWDAPAAALPRAGMRPPVAAAAVRASTSTPGTGKFSNVVGGSD